MLPSTHILIAKTAYQAVEELTGIKLNYSKFLKGSIYPDINLATLFLHHRISDTESIVEKNVNRLKDINIFEDSKKLDAFSFRMGIIIHFISDYFCKVHNEIWHKNPIGHYIYEKELDKYYSKRKRFIINTDYSTCDENLCIENRLMEYVKSQNDNFRKKRKSMKEDVAYSLKVSIACMLSITCFVKKACGKEHSIKKNGKRAA